MSASFDASANLFKDRIRELHGKIPNSIKLPDHLIEYKTNEVESLTQAHGQNYIESVVKFNKALTEIKSKHESEILCNSKRWQERFDIALQQHQNIVNDKIKLIEQLVLDKKDLTEECQKLVEDMNIYRIKYSDKLRVSEEKRQRDITAALAEAENKFQTHMSMWEINKQKEIEETALKNLEPELERILTEISAEKNSIIKSLQTRIDSLINQLTTLQRSPQPGPYLQSPSPSDIEVDSNTLKKANIELEDLLAKQKQFYEEKIKADENVFSSQLRCLEADLLNEKELRLYDGQNHHSEMNSRISEAVDQQKREFDALYTKKLQDEILKVRENSRADLHQVIDRLSRESFDRGALQLRESSSKWESQYKDMRKKLEQIEFERNELKSIARNLELEKQSCTVSLLDIRSEVDILRAQNLADRENIEALKNDIGNLKAAISAKDSTIKDLIYTNSILSEERDFNLDRYQATLVSRQVTELETIRLLEQKYKNELDLKCKYIETIEAELRSEQKNCSYLSTVVEMHNRLIDASLKHS